MEQNGEPAIRSEDSARTERGRTFVDLVSCLERSMNEVVRTFPAVDHRSRVPGTPSAAELDRIQGLLESCASPGLCAAVGQWHQLDQEFFEAANRLEEVREQGSHPGADCQARLGQCMDALRERRVALLGAAEELREKVALELDS